MRVNIPVFLKMGLNKSCIKLAYKIHKLFSANPKYKLRNLIKSGLHVVKNDRIKVHDGMFIVNSFIPPLNSLAFESILMGVSGRGSEFFDHHISGKRKFPISIYISATSRCMYSCWHCSAAKRNPGSDIGTSKMIELIQKLQDMGVGIIGFTGGEPLLRDDLEEILKSMDKRSVSFVFSTGYGLTYERARKLKEAGLLGIAISIDSVNEDEHDRMRGFNGAYKIAMEAIRNAKKAGLYTMSQTVCSKELLQGENLHDLACFMKNMDVDEMRIIEPLPCGKLGSREDVLLNESESKKLIEFHKACNRNRSMPKASVFSYFESDDQFGCGAGVQHSYIDHQGNLYPCDFVPISFGNVFETPVDKLWEGMHEAVGGPREYCISKHHLSGILEKSVKSYPVCAKTLPLACCKCESQSVPGFYRILRGEK
ncbi:MAG: radical SAM protein [Clostridia bacterium]|nr:radical SAM protein [Clostridia bacterium]